MNGLHPLFNKGSRVHWVKHNLYGTVEYHKLDSLCQVWYFVVHENNEGWWVIESELILVRPMHNTKDGDNMKILCVCQGGNSRSVAMAYVLKYHFGHDALACSAEKNSAETLVYLYDWADKIIVMQPEFVGVIPLRMYEKVIRFDVGRDRWMNGLHPQLVHVCADLWYRYQYSAPNKKITEVFTWQDGV